MSGSVGFELSLEEADAVARELAADLGVRASAELLAAVPEGELLRAQERLIGGGCPNREIGEGLVAAASGRGLPFAPIVDGETLPQTAFDAVNAGEAAELALVVGTTSNEFSMVLKDAGLTLDVVRAALVSMGIPLRDANRYLQHHGAAEPWAIAGQLITDTRFRVPSQRLTAAQAAVGGRAFSYEFSWRPTGGVFPGLSFHCLDIPFAFDLLDLAEVAEAVGPEPPRALAAGMHKALVSFVATGDPGWARFDDLSRTTRFFDDPVSDCSHPLAFERSIFDRR